MIIVAPKEREAVLNDLNALEKLVASIRDHLEEPENGIPHDEEEAAAYLNTGGVTLMIAWALQRGVRDYLAAADLSLDDDALVLQVHEWINSHMDRASFASVEPTRTSPEHSLWFIRQSLHHAMLAHCDPIDGGAKEHNQRIAKIISELTTEAFHNREGLDDFIRNAIRARR